LNPSRGKFEKAFGTWLGNDRLAIVKKCASFKCGLDTALLAAWSTSRPEVLAKC